jgi:hypothetical protein
MNRSTFWSRFFSRRDGRDDLPRLRVQAVGLTQAQIRQLRPLCDSVGDALDMRLEIDGLQGEVVLAARAFLQRTPPQSLSRLVDARPLVTCDLDDAGDPLVSALALFERRQRDLLAQLRDLPVVRGLSRQFGASGWDPGALPSSFVSSGFDDPAVGLEAPAFSADEQRLVTWLLRGLTDPAIRPLTLSYGPDAVIRVDFAQSYALVDPMAQQALRVRRERPRIVAEGTPGADAIGRDVDELAWDMGIAFGSLRLLDQPADWWHTPLSTHPNADQQRYTRVPRHLTMGAVLFGERVTPAELQRRTGCSLAALRPFLQACLFVGLAWWSPEY